MFGAIWDWLNGNKTTFGTYMMAFAGLLLSVGVVGPEDLIYKGLLYIGGLLGTTGALHKVVKSKPVA